MLPCHVACFLTAALLMLSPGKPEAAYFDPLAYQQAVGGAPSQAIPAQSVTFTDDFGSFSSTSFPPALGTGTPGAWVPYQGVGQPTPLTRFLPWDWREYGAAGSLEGSYVCASFATACLGIRTITYQLPYAIQAISGDMKARNWYQLPLTYLPFFEFTGREPAIPPGGDFGPGFCAPGSCYSGFWGKVFDTPTDTLVIPWRPFDGGADFLLSNAQVIPVPEPGSLALLLTGLAGFALLRRRGGKSREDEPALGAG